MRLVPNGSTAHTLKGGVKVDMPSYDKQNIPTNTATTPRPSQRTPFTPRVAGSSVSTISTPTSRSGTRSGYNTPSASSRDVATPVSTFITNNITPRSGSRKSRVDSTNNTPASTPNGTPLTPHINDSYQAAREPSLCRSGLGIGGVDREFSTKRSTVSFSPSVADIPSQQTPAGTADSKFFFASDAKSVPAARPSPQTKTASFVYANGETIPLPSSSSSAVGSVVGEERGHPKLLHTASFPTIHSSSPFHPAQPRAPSTLARGAHLTSPRLAPSNPTNNPLTTRPGSPSKSNSYGPIHSRTASPALSSVSSWSKPDTPSSTVGPKVRKEVARGIVQHGRSRSITPSETVEVPSRKTSSSFSSSQVNSPTTPLEPTTGSPPTVLRTREPSVDSTAPSEPQSPSKPSQSIDQLNELAANARRERKVLDLEITNSSLAAINRTLEREMRKQTAELRRYRRLSRSGRLSLLAPTSRSSSGSTSIGDGENDSQLSDSEGDSKEDEDFEFSEDESVDDPTLSPGAMAESDLRHRKKDEKRLQLDLSKHQQLLIDSQKLNQSLKRCLGWTEELINDGRKALAYHVRASDVELGGRVLVPEEVEDAEAEVPGMVTSESLMPPQDAAVPSSGGWSSTGKLDRDSGIEVGRAHGERFQSTVLDQPS